MNKNQNELRVKFETMSRITQYFPIIFESGHRIDDLAAECKHCHIPFYGNRFRGVVDFKYGNRANVFAIGICECGLYEEFIIRFHDEDDDVYAVELLENNQWHRRAAYVAQSLTNWNGLLGFMLSQYYTVKRQLIIFIREKLS